MRVWKNCVFPTRLNRFSDPYPYENSSRTLSDMYQFTIGVNLQKIPPCTGPLSKSEYENLPTSSHAPGPPSNTGLFGETCSKYPPRVLYGRISPVGSHVTTTSPPLKTGLPFCGEFTFTRKYSVPNSHDPGR